MLLDAKKHAILKMCVLPNAKKGIFLTIRKVIGSKNIHCVKTKMLSTNKKCYGLLTKLILLTESNFNLVSYRFTYIGKAGLLSYSPGAGILALFHVSFTCLL